MVEFKLFGIPVRVEQVLRLNIRQIGFFIRRGYSGQAQMIVIALFVMAGFISILIHELGHALMVKYYKLPTNIVLSSFGGYATYPPGVLSRKESFLVTLMGPLSQAVFGFALKYSVQYMNLPNTMILQLVDFLIFVSIFWAALNCVPVLPLDGGRMVEAALGPRRIKITIIISLASAVILCILAFKFKFIFGGIFMAMFAWQSYQMLEQYNKFNR